ncbi:MAG: division/cell wall cluster transcriptional repressor MraZ [Bacteroidota bacterium]|nr:MAG: division/cell wall cluster transcriptional repressor MraZ [Bacteroidota bacterium]
MSTLQPVEMDAAGRMTLPKRMLSYAGLTKDVVLQGMLNKTLIWNQETYQENNNSRSQERRKELRGRIFGFRIYQFNAGSA